MQWQKRLMRCMALISSDMDDQMVPKLIPVCSHACKLHMIVSSPQTETGGLISPMHQPWMEQFSSILKNPVPYEDPDDWSIKMEASEETMHLVLETLLAAVMAGHGISASIEPILTPIMLNMWASHVSDPFISIDALEVLELILAFISNYIVYIAKPQEQPDGLVAGSLDLVTMSVKQDMLAWPVDPGFTMRSLLDVASRYISQLILHLSGACMQSSQIAGLNSSLLLIFARLVSFNLDYPRNFWLREVQGAYQIKVMTTALILLLLTRHVELGNINVKDSDWEETRNGNAGDDDNFCTQLMLHHITDLHMNI
ncbi:hypothetical protein ACS0TY_001762 [Phlomoides rotata]